MGQPLFKGLLLVFLAPNASRWREWSYQSIPACDHDFHPGDMTGNATAARDEWPMHVPSDPCHQGAQDRRVLVLNSCFSPQIPPCSFFDMDSASFCLFFALLIILYPFQRHSVVVRPSCPLESAPPPPYSKDPMSISPCHLELPALPALRAGLGTPMPARGLGAG